MNFMNFMNFMNNSTAVSSSEFLRRFAAKTGTTLKDAKPMLYMIEDEVGKALASGREVRFSGLGIIKRARFSSKILPNPNNRQQKLLVLDRYYPHFRTSRTFKDKLRHVIFGSPLKNSTYTPRTSNLQPQVLNPKTPYATRPVPNPKGTPIPIRFRPRIPPLRHRAPMSPLYLDLSKRQMPPGEKLLRSLLHSLGASDSDLSIDPRQITFYSPEKNLQALPPALYDILARTLRQALPQAIKHPQMWRLMVNLPPKIYLNFSAAPAGNGQWLFYFQRPRLKQNDHHLVEVNLPSIVNAKIDGLFAKGAGRIAVVGAPRGQLATLRRVKKIFDTEGINYHYAVEHHHWQPHGHHTLAPHLRQLMKETTKHPILIIEHLSAADDLYQLNRFEGIVLAGFASSEHSRIGNTLARQRLPADFFDLTLESHTVPAVCEDCPPVTKPAVLFAPLRQIAAHHNSRLTNHTVCLAAADCDHKKSYRYIVVAYEPNGQIGPSLRDQLYELLLDHQVVYDAVESSL